MNYNELKTIWLSEEQRAFTGWDFSYIRSRWYSAPLPWDYRSIIDRYLEPSHTLLDMGTGGGEFLLSLKNHPYAQTSVTEAWAPNAALCRERLEPLGIHVYELSREEKLSFQNSTFDVVLNRHEFYDLDEVRRILKPEGMFITQQVGGENNRLLAKCLNTVDNPQYPNHSLTNEAPRFEAHQFEIIYSNEVFSEVQFFDVGAVVYFAKIIEWEFPDFSVDKNFLQLCELQDKLVTNGYITSYEHRFIIVAKNLKLS